VRKSAAAKASPRRIPAKKAAVRGRAAGKTLRRSPARARKAAVRPPAKKTSKK